MKWRRVDEHGFDYCYLLPDPGETDRQVVAAVAAASFNSAWPEGDGGEQWAPTVEVEVDDVRDAVPEVFGRRRFREKDEVLGMDYVGGRRCKTRIYRETRGEHRGRLKLSSGEYEAARGDVERLLRAACDLLDRRRRQRPRPTGA